MSPFTPIAATGASLFFFVLTNSRCLRSYVASTLDWLPTVPARLGWRIPQRADQLGGFLSGLLGGLVGNQGALRSGYLLNYPLSKQAFVATGTAIACLIDASRIPVYVVNYGARLTDFWPCLVAVILAAFVGTFAGKRLFERLSLPWFRAVVAALIVFTGAGLIFTNL